MRYLRAFKWWALFLALMVLLSGANAAWTIAWAIVSYSISPIYSVLFMLFALWSLYLMWKFMGWFIDEYIDNLKGLR